MKKFDVVIGNPPYTKGNEKLYTRFTKKVLELSDIILFVMPVDLQSNHVTLRSHNNLVKTHLRELGKNVSSHFNVGQNNIHIVHLDKNVVNTVEEYKNPLEQYKPILSHRKRLLVHKGSNNIEKAEEYENGFLAVHRVLRGDKLVTKQIDPSIALKASKTRKVTAPWLVFLNHTPSDGLFNCVYMKNQGQPWGMNVIAIEAVSEEEAKKLKIWMTSDTIQSEIKKMFKMKNVYTVSKEMLEILPWYE